MFATVKAIHDAALELDGDWYVPITAHVRPPPPGASIALRYGDYKHSLLEIMFCSETGLIRWLAMPTWKQPKTSPFNCVPKSTGVPVIEPPTRSVVGPLGWKRIDCPHDFDLLLQDRTLRILFQTASAPVEAIGDERIAFLIDRSKQIVGLEVNALTETELHRLNSR